MPFALSFALSISLCALITWGCIRLFRPVALHIGLVDSPGGRKTHAQIVPLIGGLSIFCGFCFSLLYLNISLQHYRGLLAGSAILVLLGVMDDFHELTPRIRLIGQLLAAILLVEWGHLALNHLGDLFFLGSITLGVFSIFFTIIFVVAFINALNMIDGNDGLAGLVVLGQALLLSFWSLHLHQMDNAYLLWILSAALCVFLCFNLPMFQRKSASIFMGDAGSTFLGFAIAWFAVDLSQVAFLKPQIGLHCTPMTILWVLAYPLYDLLAVVLHRAQTKRSPFKASRDHLHCLLLDAKMRPGRVTGLLFMFSLTMGFFGIALAYTALREAWQLAIFLGFFVLYFIATWKLHCHLGLKLGRNNNSKRVK